MNLIDQGDTTKLVAYHIDPPHTTYIVPLRKQQLLQMVRTTVLNGCPSTFESAGLTIFSNDTHVCFQTPVGTFQMPWRVAMRKLLEEMTHGTN